MITTQKQLHGTTTFGLLRHGETIWNTKKKIQGYGDSPLTAKGRQQTAEWVATLLQWQWHRIAASDLGRVRQTVAILNQSLQLSSTFHEELREQSWGRWEGMTIKDIKKECGAELDRRVKLGWDFAAPEGETRTAVRNRVLSLLRGLQEQHPGQNVLIVCHQGVIKTILYHITGREFLPGEDPLVQHNSLHLIGCDRGRFTTKQLNIPRQYRT